LKREKKREEKENAEMVRDITFGGGLLKVPRQCPLDLLVEVMHMIRIFFDVGRSACEASSAAWSLRSSAFALGLRKTTETIDLVWCYSSQYISALFAPYCPA
jgi:hypothetical protein